MNTTTQGAVPWETAAPRALIWSTRAYQMMTATPPEVSARLIRMQRVLSCYVEGSCPRCGHDITQTKVLSAITTTGTASSDEERAIRSTADKARAVTIGCVCGEEHLGRPEGKSGCGIYMNLHLYEEF